MSIDWPSTLPQKPSTEGFIEQFPNSVIRTQMDAGPAKIRRRSTAAVRPFSLVYNLTLAQVAIFDTFFNDTLAGGSLAFNLPDPRTGTTLNVRITTIPKISALGGTEFTASFDIEKLP